MLSQRAKYAIRALLMLANRPDGELVFTGEIAARESVPAKFPSAILLDLRNHAQVLYHRRAGSEFVPNFESDRPKSDWLCKKGFPSPDF